MNRINTFTLINQQCKILKYKLSLTEPPTADKDSF